MGVWCLTALAFLMGLGRRDGTVETLRKRGRGLQACACTGFTPAHGVKSQSQPSNGCLARASSFLPVRCLERLGQLTPERCLAAVLT